jgi:hypothetical protein
LLYTFTLRPGLRFSDGSPVTTRDVIATLKRLFIRDSQIQSLAQHVAALEAVNDGTFTFHYYDPFAFTGQGLSWLLDGRYRYLTGLTWPYDAANAQAVLENALGLVGQDPHLTAAQGATLCGAIEAALQLGAIRRLIQGLEGNTRGIWKEPEDRPPPRRPCGDRGGIGGADQARCRGGWERARHHHHVYPHSLRERLLDDPIGEEHRLLLV